MNADIIPTEIAVVILTELLFGFGYNQLVAYWTKHNLMHVSWAVVIGVAATLLIPALFWFDTNMPFYATSLLLLACFAASGTPMIAGSMHRTVQEKETKKRRPLGNAAMRIRDEVVMATEHPSRRHRRTIKDKRDQPARSAIVRTPPAPPDRQPQNTVSSRNHPIILSLQ